MQIAIGLDRFEVVGPNNARLENGQPRVMRVLEDSAVVTRFRVITDLPEKVNVHVLLRKDIAFENISLAWRPYLSVTGSLLEFGNMVARIHNRFVPLFH
jgi:hypothetical protein